MYVKILTLENWNLVMMEEFLKDNSEVDGDGDDRYGKEVKGDDRALKEDGRDAGAVKKAGGDSRELK